MMKDATQSSIVRSIHIVFSISILGCSAPLRTRHKGPCLK